MFAELIVYLIWIVGLLGLIGFVYRLFDSVGLKEARIPVRSRQEGRTRR